MSEDEKIVVRVFGIGLLMLLGFGTCAGGLSFVGGYTRLASADHVIGNYEWFFDAKNTVDARVAQISAEKTLIADETDPKELQRLRVDLGGMQQSCRELVAEYNSKAREATRSIFQSHELPDRLDAEVCE